MTYDPASVHPLIDDVAEKQELVETLYGGTVEMREAGNNYLPQEEGETATNYSNRLARSVLFPAYKNAVKANTGKLYTKDVTVTKSTDLMDGFFLQVDEEDNDLTEFSKNITENAINNGCSYLLVDYPPLQSSATLADEREAGGRPYWVNIKQSQVLEASPIRHRGRKKLGVFRFKEEIAFRVDRFYVKYIQQIKQFEFNESGFVIFTTFQKNQENKWIEVDSGILIDGFGKNFTEIPIIAVNLDPVGFYVGQPVFYDLAEENKQHWQMSSDYNNIVHHSQVPMLKITGLSATFDEAGNRDNPVVISPNTVLDFGNENADAEWIEVSGQASAVGEKALTSSIRRMAVMSLQLLVNSDASATATASKIDALESMSVLQSIGKKTEQAIDKAINITYKYFGIDNPGTLIELNLDDAIIFGNANDIDSLIKMYDSNLLSQETILKEFKRRGTLCDNMDVSLEIKNTARTGSPIDEVDDITNM